jgi:arginine N-succinyltransferase
MILIRPVQERDLDRLEELAKSIEGGGMTTLPADREILAQKIKTSLNNFSKTIKHPGPETYLLVLEDLETGQVGGTAAVFARIGLEKAFYTYSLTKTTHVSMELSRHHTHDVLHLVNDYIGFAEVGSLYLDPKFRKPNAGRILARSRYLFIGEHRSHFPDEVVAEMRGWQDEDGQSPFWEALGKHFFGMSFQEADHLSATSNNQFIADLMPKFPVYVDLLPKAAQEVIGQAHEGAVPALKLLEWEGFRSHRHVDIFDAGPCVQARVDNIRAIRDAKISKLSGTEPEPNTQPEMGFNLDLVSTGHGIDFRSSCGMVRVDDKGEVSLAENLAEALRVSKGDTVRHTSLR